MKSVRAGEKDTGVDDMVAALTEDTIFEEILVGTTYFRSTVKI